MVGLTQGSAENTQCLPLVNLCWKPLWNGPHNMDQALWTTHYGLHSVVHTIVLALYTMHSFLCTIQNARCAMQCLPLVNLWWKPPQPWPCQTRPTSWVKHTGKRQRSKMEISCPYMLEKNMALLHPELFKSDLFVFPPPNLCILQFSSCICG